MRWLGLIGNRREPHPCHRIPGRPLNSISLLGAEYVRDQQHVADHCYFLLTVFDRMLCSIARVPALITGPLVHIHRVPDWAAQGRE